MSEELSGRTGSVAAAPWQTLRATSLGIEKTLRGEALFRLIRPIVLAVLAVGLIARLTPLFDIKNRLFWQYMSEDGYLMQTIARNMAIGLGMSTADGTIPTNGVQPLATFIFAALHWGAGGERTASIVLVTLVSAAIATGAAYSFYRLAKLLLRDMQFGDQFALIISAAWFVGPLPLAHSMNGLETGLYLLTMTASLAFFIAHFGADADHVRTPAIVMLGILLGVTFLSRNDAVFFIAAVLLTLLLTGRYDRPALTRRFIECVGAGVISIAIALPWLINNYRLFGTVVPISGISQSHDAVLGTNLRAVPAKLFEVAVPNLPLPNSIEAMPIVVAATTLFVIAVVLAYWLLWGRYRRETRMFMSTTLLFGTALVTYYGLFFGAPHFLARYLSVLSPMLWIMTATVGLIMLVAILQRARFINLAVVGMLSVLLIGAAAWAALIYREGQSHMHRQVVEWTAANVKPDQWTGAVQTGTLGYFHDRTLNLDGKVNPAALRELLQHGHVLDYVVGTPVAFIVDWAGLSDWAENRNATNFNRHFELIVKDDNANLSAYQRRGRPPSR